MLIGIGYSYFDKAMYSAESTFVLEDQGGSSLGQYAGIASMVGLNIGSGGGDGIFKGDNIIQLYKSRRMIEKTLLTPADFGSQSELLINRYIDIKQIKKKLKDQSLKILDFRKGVQLTTAHDSLITVIIKDISENSLTVSKPDKKLSIIRVAVTFEDELFAKEFANCLIKNVNDFYVQTKIRKSSENVSVLQRQADSMKNVLNRSIYGAASSVDANPNANLALQVLKAPSQRGQIDIQANTAIYSEIIKNLELAKISLRMETPLIQMIDEPVLPLARNKVGFVKGAVFGTVISTLLAFAYLLLARVIKSLEG